MGICTELSNEFINVGFLEGNILHETVTSSTQGCVAMCARRTTSCRGSRYNVASEECQLIDKWSSALTTTFYADSEWNIFMQVSHVVN